MISERRRHRDVGEIRAWLDYRDAMWGRTGAPRPGAALVDVAGLEGAQIPVDLAVYLELEVALRELVHFGQIRWAADSAGALALLQDERLPARHRRV